MKRMKPPKTVAQAAALAIQDGRVCLVTSRSGKRWVVPKGCLERGKTPDEIVLQEAWEEAGLIGELRDGPVGSFTYRKGGKTHVVSVYVMEVTDVLTVWPECRRRERRWLPIEKALNRVREEGLRELLRVVLGLSVANT
jgi:8-oxo-dGTP pyrophosphatase MutT (NUDIX family)